MGQKRLHGERELDNCEGEPQQLREGPPQPSRGRSAKSCKAQHSRRRCLLRCRCCRHCCRRRLSQQQRWQQLATLPPQQQQAALQLPRWQRASSLCC